MIHIFSTGGTVDKVYFDANSEFHTGAAQAPRLLLEGNVDQKAYQVKEVCRKDSLEITSEDRQSLIRHIADSASQHILITHGTDTLVETAQAIAATISNKTIVLVGAMQPALLRLTDAPFNLGFALAAVQLLPSGIYIAMNGKVFPHDKVEKNREKGCFQVKT